MKFLAYILYFAVVAGSVVLREYQLSMGADGSVLSDGVLIRAACVLGALALLTLASLFLSRVKTAQGKSAVPGVLNILFSLLICAYGGYSTYLATVSGETVMGIAANASNLLLGLGVLGEGLYMRQRGRKKAGFLLLLVMLWPVMWLLQFVAGNTVFIHRLDDLINFAFLISGCVFYLQLCTKWCVPDASPHNRRTLFTGLLHAGLFAMANLPACIYQFLHGGINLTLCISTAFFAVYLLNVFTVCIYLRGAGDPAAAVLAEDDEMVSLDDKASAQEIAEFFSKNEEKSVEAASTWLDDAPAKQQKRMAEEELFSFKEEKEIQMPEPKQSGPEPVKQEEKEPEVVAAPEPAAPQQDHTQESMAAAEKLIPYSVKQLLKNEPDDDDPVGSILKELRQKKATQTEKKEEPFVYRGKGDDKRPGRFKQ